MKNSGVVVPITSPFNSTGPAQKTDESQRSIMHYHKLNQSIASLEAPVADVVSLVEISLSPGLCQ